LITCILKVEEMPTKNEMVKGFYDKTPFPDYELNRFITKEDLKINANNFAKILDKSIPQNASIIDIGTGTGQLSAFLSLRRKHVLGIDFSDTAINKCKELKRKLKLNSWDIERIDILDDKMVERLKTKFDYALCFGVLHHTSDPYKGFQNILKLLKPEGHIAIGLYNKFGRLPHQIRKILVRNVFRYNKDIKNAFLRLLTESLKDKKKAEGIWNDQYFNPYETTHTIGEILRWFKNNNIEYYQTIPTSTLFDKNNFNISGVWNKTGQIYPSFFIRTYIQLTWIWKTQHEGGYWITFGRKK
jgi:SAM-dependent methyltransferase